MKLQICVRLQKIPDRRTRHAPATWGFLAAGAALLAAFGYIETRASQPLLPLRIVADRNRAASYVSILITGAGMFGIFLFLTYYLQETLGFSPVTAGLAFLPMVAGIVVCSNLANIVLLPRIGPRFLVASGMLAAAAGLAWLTRIGVHSSYAADVLPALLLTSAGLGFVMSPSMNTGTAGVAPSDAGMASAVVNTGQQVGGSIGTSLLNTMAASAAASYLAAHLSRRAAAAGRPTATLTQLAQVHSYTTAFWWRRPCSPPAPSSLPCCSAPARPQRPRPPQPRPPSLKMARCHDAHRHPHARSAHRHGYRSAGCAGRPALRHRALQRSSGRQHIVRRPGSDRAGRAPPRSLQWHPGSTRTWPRSGAGSWTSHPTPPRSPPPSPGGTRPSWNRRRTPRASRRASYESRWAGVCCSAMVGLLFSPAHEHLRRALARRMRARGSRVGGPAR